MAVGGKLTELMRGGMLANAHALAVDGDVVYWVEQGGLGAPSNLYRWRPGGGARPSLVASENNVVRALGFDESYLYFTAIDRVLRVARSPGSRPEALVSDEPQASDLAVVGDYLYWTNPWFGQGVRGRPRGPLDGTVRRMRKPGGKVESIFRSAEGDSLRLLAHDDRSLFLSTGAAVVAVDQASGTARELARDERSSPMAGAAVGDWLVFTAGGELRKVAKRGGPVSVLAKAQILMLVAARDTEVLVARNLAYGSPGVILESAALLRVGLDGQGATEVNGLTFQVQQLVAVSSGIYVIDAPLLGAPGEARLLVAR